MPFSAKVLVRLELRRLASAVFPDVISDYPTLPTDQMNVAVFCPLKKEALSTQELHVVIKKINKVRAIRNFEEFCQILQ